MFRFLICLVILVPLNGYPKTTPDIQECEIFTTTQLFFGRNINPHGEVTEKQWHIFLDEQVSPRIIGYTVIDAEGYWKGSREKTKVLVVKYKTNTDTNTHLETIVSVYKELFNQESVMRSDNDSCVKIYYKRNL